MRDITETHNAGVAARNIFHPGLVLGICLKYNNNLSTDYRLGLYQTQWRSQCTRQVWRRHCAGHSAPSVGGLTDILQQYYGFHAELQEQQELFAAGKCNR